MKLYYEVLAEIRNIYWLLGGLTLLFSLLLGVIIDKSIESFLIRAIIVGILIFLLFVLPLLQKIVVDETGILWQNLFTRWHMQWSNMDYWDVQEQNLFIFEKGGRYRCLPPECINLERMLAIERELQKRLPRAPIPFSSSLRTSADWDKGKQNG